MLDRRTLRRHIKTLERRRDHLGQRLNDLRNRRTGSDDTYDRAEFNALGVAIERLEDYYTTLPKVPGEGPIKAAHK